MKVYIVGPVTGYPHRNHHAFDAAEHLLAEAGYEVVNPLLVPIPLINPSWSDYMRIHLTVLMTCDGVATIQNWIESNGARVAVELAHDLGMVVLPADRWASQ